MEHLVTQIVWNLFEIISATIGNTVEVNEILAATFLSTNKFPASDDTKNLEQVLFEKTLFKKKKKC